MSVRERDQHAYIVTSKIKIFCHVVALRVGWGKGQIWHFLWSANKTSEVIKQTLP